MGSSGPFPRGETHTVCLRQNHVGRSKRKSIEADKEAVRMDAARSPGMWERQWSGEAPEEGPFELGLEGCIGVLPREKRRKRGLLRRGTDGCPASWALPSHGVQDRLSPGMSGGHSPARRLSPFPPGFVILAQSSQWFLGTTSALEYQMVQWWGGRGGETPN